MTQHVIKLTKALLSNFCLNENKTLKIELNNGNHLDLSLNNSLYVLSFDVFLTMCLPSTGPPSHSLPVVVN